MDFYPYTVNHKVLSYENEGGINSDIGFQIEDCIAKDNVQGFLSLSKGYLFMLWINKEKQKNPQLGMSKLLQLICDHHAVDCAIALILGKTLVRVDLNAASEEGLLPLHYAALSLSYDLSRVFLYFGAETFLRCNAVGHRLYGLLPLEVALETLSNHVKWTPEESIFKLVIILSMLRQSNQFYTIKLLAWNTKDVKQVFLRCAKEGKLMELATLLVVAQEMVIRKNSKIPRAKGSVNAFTHDRREDDYIVLENMTLRQYIASEIAFLITEENRLNLGACHALVQKENKKKMMSVMLLLEVFQRAGSYLGDTVMLYSFDSRQFDCSRIPFVANMFASWLEHLGFALKNEVLIQKPEDCFSAELLKMLAETRESDTIPALVCPGALRHVSSGSMSSTRTAKELRRTLRYVSGEKQELSFGMRRFHALRTYSSCATQPPIAMESQVKKTYKVTTNCVAKFLSSKQLSFLFVLKKGIRRI